MKEEYIRGFYCSKCNSKLTHYQLHYMGGVCPTCGNISGTSIIDHNVRARRWVSTSSAWAFWSTTKGYYEYADNMVTVKK